ncbi:MAG TPA: PaaI family thioesterase [Pseudonocardia sp.]|nr:PaaI family thioesterase [Pseudonocardia sp.]
MPYGPLWYLTGLEMTEFGVGSAAFRLPCTGWLQGPAGVVPGGVLALAAYGPLAAAIHTALGPGRVPATSDLMLDVVRPPDPGSEGIVVRSRLVHEGGAQGLSEATIEDTDGHLLGRATARCVIVDVPGPLPDPPHGALAWPEYPGPHPFERPAEGEVLPQDLWDRTSGIDILRGWQHGSLPRSPLASLLGAELRDVEDGAVTYAMPASRWFCGMQGALYGGCLALFADHAVHGAVQSVLPGGHAWATLDLTVRFLRPLVPGTDPLIARARVVHRGRRLAVVAVEIAQSGVRPAMLADASLMLLPHRRWADLAQLTDEPHDFQARRG